MEKPDIFIMPCLYLALINLTAFTAMGVDKRRAKRGAWRISERSLFLLSLLGGAFGGTAGMLYFHHKTRHWYFRYGFPALLTLQLLLGICAGYLFLRAAP